MSDEASLLDVLNYGRRAIRAAKEKDAFLRDEVAQSAVAYCISVMGEAVKRLSPEFQQSHPEVNWSDIAKMRDFLVHTCHRVDGTWFGTR
jgi:uncharacterized protein with HEPN domain